MPRIYETISGHQLEYPDPTPEVDAFLRRIAEGVRSKKISHRELVALVYSSENPILDHALMPGRGMVTPAVLDNPVYHVIADMLFRREVEDRGESVDRISAPFTMTVAEAAEQIGISDAAVRQAIASRRLGAWIKDGRHYLDPRAVATFQVAPRGQRPVHKPRFPALYIEKGHKEGKTLKVAGLAFEKGKNEGTWAGDWGRAAIFIADGEKMSRMHWIVPDMEREAIVLGPFSVAGGFRIERTENNARRAREAFAEVERAFKAKGRAEP